MNIENFSEVEIKERFNDFGSKMYNLRYSFELFLEYLEMEEDVSLKTVCLGHVLKAYLEKTKAEYNRIEEEFELLI